MKHPHLITAERRTPTRRRLSWNAVYLLAGSLGVALAYFTMRMNP